VDELGRPVRLYAGDWRRAHRLACAEYADSHTLRISEKRPLVVASAGGAPYDINLIQAHKALEMASYACEEGGHIILLAECADGMGRPDFLNWFEPADSRALGRRLLEAYEVNGQTAWSLLTKAERFRVQLVSSLPEADVRSMGLHPARTLEEALAATNAKAPGYVMPRGAAFMPVVSPEVADADTSLETGIH
jgi:nickel-dependent lactate racemase